MSRSNLQVSLAAMLIIAAVVGGVAMLTLIAHRNREAARDGARRIACINNLRMIDGAKDQYYLEYGSFPSTTVPRGQDISPYIKSMQMVFCPSHKGTNRNFAQSYAINDFDTDHTCRAFSSNKEHRLVNMGL